MGTSCAPVRNAEGTVALPQGVGAIATDSNVPEGHKGLHGFLYGESGAEVHDDEGRDYQTREGEDDGTSLVPVERYLAVRQGEKPLGVYALYDSRRNLQYVGYARNMTMAIKGHAGRVGEERCAYVRALVVANRALMSRGHLEEQANNWLAEAGTLPPGNGVERDLWEGTTPVSGLPAADVAVLEERALKMRKAMGENLADDVAGESVDSKQRRLNLIRAVEGDDWSSVIDGQTAQTIEDSGNGAEAPTHPASTPFARASVHRSIGDSAPAETPDLTPESVNAALDEVRPYLIADGGNVEVASISDGVVYLRLQGACGTCPSSAGTMKMGIERALQGAFGDKLKGVLQVDATSTASDLASVDAHLDMLRPAIASYGASVQVLSVSGGVCKVQFGGPPPIGMGVQAAIKDKFPDIKTVELVS
ncbi:NifU-domain-containing protein [Coccomyxa subellipsoidea C-169]|uniref:NifU-domain-containing protein n=1 Tax=Coccomyxa subellipsoidea (strain C-169) TaxID=574566 RepID=I0YYE4_COCSC|nr:NifU-domain-containing protein [Coccomyxa subellipsoidea C-169]EIE23413.1 NifU-domain-containing protein [Coccomyxa subellipsoidea C-169]|eukprot:XP_005647957.1 NifU-domain-containing protein [Coccomyxa subellipsoidea C-169]